MTHLMTRSLIVAVTFAVIAWTATAQPRPADKKKEAEKLKEEDKKWRASPEGQRAVQELAQINAAAWFRVLGEGEDMALLPGGTKFGIGVTTVRFGGNPADVCTMRANEDTTQTPLWCLSGQFPGVRNARGFRFKNGALHVLDGFQKVIWSSPIASLDAPTYLVLSNGRLMIIKVGAEPNANNTRVYWSSGPKLVK